MIFTPIYSLSHFSPLRDIENQKITVFDSGFNFGKKKAERYTLRPSYNRIKWIY